MRLKVGGQTLPITGQVRHFQRPLTVVSHQLDIRQVMRSSADQHKRDQQRIDFKRASGTVCARREHAADQQGNTASQSYCAKQR